jgi:hypothetical protein
VALARREQQRRRALAVGRVGAHALPQQPLDGVDVAGAGGKQQRLEPAVFVLMFWF